MSGKNQTDYVWKRTNTPQEQIARELSSLKKGDEIYCTLSRLGKPKKGKIIALTTNPAKQIGLEFDEDVAGCSCDGRGKQGYCLWAKVEHLATESMVKAQLAQCEIDEARAAERNVDTQGEVESLDLTAGLET